MKKLIKPLCLLTGLLCAPAVLLHNIFFKIKSGY